jgi:hypothetical protein
VPIWRHRAPLDPGPRDLGEREWRSRYGWLPTSYDWSVSHASRRGREALLRLKGGAWPAASTVSDVYGSWAAARADAFPDA